MTASGGRRMVSREVPVKQPIRYTAPQSAEAGFEPGSRGRVLRNLLLGKQHYIEAVGQGALREYDLLAAFFAEAIARRLPPT